MVQRDAASAASRFTPQQEAGRDDIYDYYARFRESDRVARGEPAWEGGNEDLVLLRFEDVSQWLRDPRLGREWRRLMPPGKGPPPPAPNSFGEVGRALG